MRDLISKQQRLCMQDPCPGRHNHVILFRAGVVSASGDPVMTKSEPGVEPDIRLVTQSSPLSRRSPLSLIHVLQVLHLCILTRLTCFIILSVRSKRGKDR